MTTTTPPRPAPAGHATDDCGHCREERAAGLVAYTDWREAAPAEAFEDRA